MNSPLAAVPTMPIAARWTGKRLCRWLLAVVITIGVVYWWQFVRLSSLEQQLVGTWEGSRDTGKSRTIHLYCDLRADRTAVVEFVSAATQTGQPLPQRIRLKQPTWSAKDGQLKFQEPLSPWTRLRLWFYSFQEWFRTGTAGSFRLIDGLGPIRDLRPGSFEMGEWHMKRVGTRAVPE
jgi:hypothetical protein